MEIVRTTRGRNWRRAGTERRAKFSDTARTAKEDTGISDTPRAVQDGAKISDAARTVNDNGGQTPENIRDSMILRARDTFTRQVYAEETAAELADKKARKLYDMAQRQGDAVRMLGDVQRQLEQARQSTDAMLKMMAEEAKNLRIALEIARRIASGGRVPPEDEQWLMQYSPEMYMSAKMEAMRAEENHEEYDSLLESEEDAETGTDTGAADTSGAEAGTESAGVPETAPAETASAPVSA